MKYYIIQNDKVVEADDLAFDNWIDDHVLDYLLPEYSLVINGTFYGLETVYNGAIDVNEEILPFVLLYFEIAPVILADGLEINTDPYTIEYFATFEELKKRYLELENEIETKVLLQ